MLMPTRRVGQIITLQIPTLNPDICNIAEKEMNPCLPN
jgi:hypothetical protein